MNEIVFMEHSDIDTADAEPPPNSLLQGRTILLVNTGSPNKRFILERLKELGLTIVMLHREKNWAHPFVDHWILADTYNHRECAEQLKRFLLKNSNVRIEGVTTFWEDDIPLVAKICEEFRYRGNSTAAALNTRSKFHMHEVLRDNGRPFIPQRLLENENDLDGAMSSVGFPAVIKPKFGSDSQFVVYVANEKEARAGYQYVRENCTQAFDPIYHYNKGKFVYQKFIQGPEFSAECYVQNGVPHVAGLNEKTGMELPFFMETGDYCPARLNDFQKQQLEEEVKAAVRALGVENSLAHVEIKLTKNGPQIIEVASRMGGVYIYQNVKQVYGFDLIRAACEIAFGIKVTGIPLPPQKYIFAKFFIPKVSGVIAKMNGFGDLKRHAGVVDFYIGKTINDPIFVPPDGYETLGWVIAEGSSHKEAHRIVEHVMDATALELTLPNIAPLPEAHGVLAKAPVPLLL